MGNPHGLTEKCNSSKLGELLTEKWRNGFGKLSKKDIYHIVYFYEFPHMYVCLCVTHSVSHTHAHNTHVTVIMYLSLFS